MVHLTMTRRALVFAALAAAACSTESRTMKPAAPTEASASRPTGPDGVQGATLNKPPQLPLTSALLAKIDAMHKNPTYLEHTARLRRVTDRGPIAFAFTETPLPAGVLAEVRLGQLGAVPRYALVSRASFDDLVIQLVQASALGYEMRFEDDHSPVTITVHADKRIEAQSESLGHVDMGAATHGVIGDLHRHSAAMLAALPAAEAQQIPGVPVAVRVVHIPDAHTEK